MSLERDARGGRLARLDRHVRGPPIGFLLTHERRVDGGRARAKLAQPIDDTLFFAGEGTCSTGRDGTVDGAMATAHRDAPSAVDVAPVTDLHGDDDEASILDFVDHPIVALAEAIALKTG